jgi:hypothetical protein
MGIQKTPFYLKIGASFALMIVVAKFLAMLFIFAYFWAFYSGSHMMLLCHGCCLVTDNKKKPIGLIHAT